MTRIMILSSNVLAEQELQLKLQQMNYEVFVSASILQQPVNTSLSSLLEYFQVVIFSEYLLEEEIQQLVPYGQQAQAILIRRVFQQTASEPEASWLCVSAAASPVELKQLIETSRQEQPPPQPIAEVAGKCNLLQKISFTPKEVQLLHYLYQERGQLVSKQMICRKLWNQEVSDSRKVQIYTLMGQLKRKLASINGHTIFIGAQRSNGYYLTQEFFHQFHVDFPTTHQEGGG